MINLWLLFIQILYQIYVLYLSLWLLSWQCLWNEQTFLKFLMKFNLSLIFPFIVSPFFDLSRTCLPTPGTRFFSSMLSSRSFIVFYIEVYNLPSSYLYLWCEAEGQPFLFYLSSFPPTSFSILFYSYSSTFGWKDFFSSLNEFFFKQPQLMASMGLCLDSLLFHNALLVSPDLSTTPSWLL